ncbi:MAG: DNA alkylation repair protein [Betaproteobacteria bacterium]
MLHPSKTPVGDGLQTVPRQTVPRRTVPRQTVSRVAREVHRAKRELVARARSTAGFDASRYFRAAGDLGFHNVGTASVRALARAIQHDHRDDWTVADAAAFADAMVRDRFLEAKGVGIEVLAGYRRSFTPALLRQWKQWLAAGYSTNWATTDGICGSLVGPLLVDRPALAPKVAAWAGDRNMWVRRASAVALIPSVRRGVALDLAYRVAAQLHRDGEDLIQKAVGWLLREAGKRDMGRLEAYLRAKGAVIPRTTVRYAIERFPAAKRAALLRATRA